jgi:hypothetical protein
VGDAATAPIYNPALLSTVNVKEKFSISLPIGVQLSDQNNLRQSVTDFQNGNYVSNLDNAITTYNNNPNATTLNTVGTQAQTLSSQLNTLGNKNLAVNAGAALVIGVPRKNWGFAFYTNSNAEIGAVMNYKDQQLFADFSSATSSIANCLNQTGSSAQSICAQGLASDAKVNRFFPNLASGSTISSFNANNDIKSNVNIRGAIISEVGVSLSNEFTFGQGIALGITPKIVNAQLIDYTAGVNNASTTTPTGSDYVAKYNMFNLDLGAAKKYANGWRAGFVIKNLVPYNLDFYNKDVALASGTQAQLNLKPLARVGGSWENTWSTVALDVDLTRNDPAGLGNASQFVALGGEVRVWKLMQLRAGYRADLANSSNSVASVGLGLGFLPIDIAVAGNQNQIGASMQLAMHF